MATHEMDVDPFENRDALRDAVVNRQPTVIRHLLRQKADLRFTDQNGNTALHMVFDKDPFFINQPSIIATLKILFDHGMHPNTSNNEGKTALHLAIKCRLPGVIDFLIKRGAILNICDGNGDSTAHLLVDSEFDECCKTYLSEDAIPSLQQFSNGGGEGFVNCLMSKGLNVNCRNKDGLIPAHLAAQFNLQHILLELLEGTDDLSVNYVNQNNQNILHSLIESLPRLREDFNKQEKPTSIPIGYKNSVFTNIVKSLLVKGISVDVIDKNDNTPLHLAAKHTGLEVIKLMLEKFTNVDACDLDGNTVLHTILINSRKLGYNLAHAVDECNEHVRVLLSKGANVHMKNKAGLVPLQIAVSEHLASVMTTFKQYEADFNVVHDDGNLLHFLARNNYIWINKWISRSMVDLLVFHGCDVNSVNKYGFTPLHRALRWGNVTIADRLIKLGADVRARELAEDNFTTLHLAANYSSESHIVKFIEAGIDANVRDARGRTPLHLAASSTINLIVLLRRGAYVDARDHEGNLPLHTVLRRKDVAGVRVLLEYGADINDQNALREVQSLIARRKDAVAARAAAQWAV